MKTTKIDKNVLSYIKELYSNIIKFIFSKKKKKKKTTIVMKKNYVGK